MRFDLRMNQQAISTELTEANKRRKSGKKAN